MAQMLQEPDEVGRRVGFKDLREMHGIWIREVCTGVSLQKVPDRTFDRTGTNLTYTLLATTITEQ